jgi:hypothetical protein
VRVQFVLSYRGVDAKRLKSVVVFAEVSEAISREKQHGIEEGGVGGGGVLFPCAGLQKQEKRSGKMMRVYSRAKGQAALQSP